MKGGGGALTREKILAGAARRFVCVVDETKLVATSGKFPLPIEVIPMARSYVARQMVKAGGNPVYREGFVTDNGNDILDVHDLGSRTRSRWKRASTNSGRRDGRHLREPPRRRAPHRRSGGVKVLA